MSFRKKYTTKSLKLKDPLGEKDKIEVSDDTYCLAELLALLSNRLVK